MTREVSLFVVASLIATSVVAQDRTSRGAGKAPEQEAAAPRGPEPTEAEDGQKVPAPAPQPEPKAPPVSGVPVGVTTLRDDLTSLMDDLVQARARVAMLGKALFKTKLVVRVNNEADDQSLQRIVLKLDGAPIFRGDASALDADGDKKVFEGFAAPGPHVLIVEAEQRDRADDRFRYTLRERFDFTVVRGRRTTLSLTLDDDSDMGEDFPADRQGQYDVRTRLEIEAVPLKK